ncbi:MAG: thioredoxin [Cyclobacteriaceae bacterium]|nr:thioredoxin [Cyclobacteriaceae bacterium]
MKYEEIVKSHPLVLVDFYADWCGPCKMMVPVFKELKSAMGDKVKIVKIDTDRNQQLSAKMGIRSIPTMVLYKEGQQVWQQPGAMPMHTLKSKIESFI